MSEDLRGELERCLRGESGAADAFVDAAVPLVHAVVERLLRSGASCDPSASAEDIAQEVFLKLFREDMRLLRAYDPARASAATWLAVVARSVAIDILRRKRPPTASLESASEEQARAEDPDGAPEPPRVPEGLLSARQMLVMQLLYEKGLGVREAARALGIEEQSVRSLRHKALVKLRALFGRAETGSAGGDVPGGAAVEREGGGRGRARGR